MIPRTPPRCAHPCRPTPPRFGSRLDDLKIGVDWRFVGDRVHASVVATVRDALGLLGDLGAVISRGPSPRHRKPGRWLGNYLRRRLRARPCGDIPVAKGRIRAGVGGLDRWRLAGDARRLCALGRGTGGIPDPARSRLGRRRRHDRPLHDWTDSAGGASCSEPPQPEWPRSPHDRVHRTVRLFRPPDHYVAACLGRRRHATGVPTHRTPLGRGATDRHRRALSRPQRGLRTRPWPD